MHLRALVRAVLAPHDRIHRELAGRRAAAEDLPDPGVLVVLEAELCVRLLDVRRRLGVLHGVHGQARVLTRALARRLAAPCPWSRSGPHSLHSLVASPLHLTEG